VSTLELALPVGVFAVFATALSIVDAKHHILPNRLVFAGCTSILGMQWLVSLQIHATNPVRQSLLTATQTLMVYIILLLVSRGQLGMGDVKFSIMTGLIIGWVAPHLWLVNIWAAFAMAAIWALFARVRGGQNLKTVIAFGPFMSLSTALCAALAWVNF